MLKETKLTWAIPRQVYKSTVKLKFYSSGIYMHPTTNSGQIYKGQEKVIKKIPKKLSVVEATLLQ